MTTQTAHDDTCRQVSAGRHGVNDFRHRPPLICPYNALPTPPYAYNPLIKSLFKRPRGDAQGGTAFACRQGVSASVASPVQRGRPIRRDIPDREARGVAGIRLTTR
jgi:hypothetical protein